MNRIAKGCAINNRRGGISSVQALNFCPVSDTHSLFDGPLTLLITEQTKFSATDSYANDGGPEAVYLLCSFYHDPLHIEMIRNVDNFAT